MTRALPLIRTAAAWLGSTLWHEGDASETLLYLCGAASFIALIAKLGGLF